MKASFLVIAFCVAALAPFARAQQVLESIAGQSSGDRFGTAVLTLPDLDGDGVDDLAVGAPGDGGGTGALYVVSGQSMATAGGATLLWIVVPPGSPAQAAFGHSLALVGNLVGDSTPDLVVGAPNAVFGGTTTGALYLIDGATMTIASLVTGYSNSRSGRALAAVGDQDGDGLPDLIATTSATTNSNLRMSFIPGNALAQGGSLTTIAPTQLGWGANQAGENLATGFDHDGDGRLDFAVGAPDHSILHIRRADGSWTILGLYSSADTNERAATSISAAEDYDGDGAVDFLIGAPNWADGTGTQHGRVIVVSGASILTPNWPPVVIASLNLPLTGPVIVPMHLGTAVRASPDLTGDGVGEILAGAPLYSTPSPFGPVQGALSIFSGATLSPIGLHVGANYERLGDSIVPGFHDLDADGFLDFVVAGSVCDNPTTACGVVKSLSLYPAAPSSYCTSKTNSLGCVPAIGWSGSSSVSATSPFAVTCASVLNQVSGLFFYSHAPYAAPFQGGTMCVKPPLRRSPVLTSGGSTSGTDCTGVFSLDFAARIASGVDPTLVAGSQVFIQCWSRDPASPSTTSLSDALRFLINP